MEVDMKFILCVRQLFNSENIYSNNLISPYIEIETESREEAETIRWNMFRGGKISNHRLEGTMKS